MKGREDPRVYCHKYTVCPKVPLKRNLVVFSAVCGWILKPFELQIVLECGFDMMYIMAQ